MKGLVKAIAALKDDRKLLSEMKANARRCFEENFDIAKRRWIGIMRLFRGSAS